MPSRLDTFQEDVKKIKKDYVGKPSFGDLEIGEQAVSFTLSCKKEKKRFTCCVSEDYPENSFVTCSDEPANSKVYHVRLPLIIAQLAHSVCVKESAVEVMSSSEMGSAAGSSIHRPSVERLVSEESTASSYVDCHSDVSSSDDDCAEYYSEQADYLYEDEDVQCPMNPIMYDDIENSQLLYGDRAVQYRLFGSIDDIDVELHLPLSFLEEEVAKAWRVLADEPLVVRLHMSTTMYLDCINSPKIEVFQPSKQNKCGVASQMRVIMETFVSNQWKLLTNEKVKSTSTVLPSRAKHSVTMSELSALDSASGYLDSYPVDDGSLAQLVDMGFTMDIARNALIITRGNTNEASNLLISNPDSCVNIKLDTPVPMVVDLTASDAVGGNSTESKAVPVDKPPPLPPRRQHSHPSKRFSKFKPKLTKRQTSMTTSNTAPDLHAPPSDLHLLVSETLDGKNAKTIPSLEHGFLTQVYRYARQRIPTLNEYCVVCDEPHIFQNGAMLKPAVCSRELCVFAYQTLGVMADAAEDIATGAEVVDLLIAMARAACLSPRKELIFDPYPTVVDPKNPNELALHPKNMNFARVNQSLQNFLSMDEMTQQGGIELKKELDVRDSLSYPLLQWIIASNRSHIVKLPPDKQLSFMDTPHQFLLLSSPPATEAIFRAEKEKHSSTFAFHGSNIENWHSILRNGLLNASGTKFQVNGAAYGKGIYLSPQASVSFGYSGICGVQGGYAGKPLVGKRKPSAEDCQHSKKNAQLPICSSRFLKGKNITCVALCEVITSKELKKNHNIWVCPNTNHVCTRFFFLYEEGLGGDPNVDTQKDYYKKEIHRACGYKAGMA